MLFVPVWACRYDGETIGEDIIDAYAQILVQWSAGSHGGAYCVAPSLLFRAIVDLDRVPRGQRGLMRLRCSPVYRTDFAAIGCVSFQPCTEGTGPW